MDIASQLFGIIGNIATAVIGVAAVYIAYKQKEIARYQHEKDSIHKKVETFEAFQNIDWEIRRGWKNMENLLTAKSKIDAVIGVVTLYFSPIVRQKVTETANALQQMWEYKSRVDMIEEMFPKFFPEEKINDELKEKNYEKLNTAYSAALEASESLLEAAANEIRE